MKAIALGVAAFLGKRLPASRGVDAGAGHGPTPGTNGRSARRM